MRLDELVKEMDFKVLTDGSDLSIDVTGGYASDLMSDVIANAQPGDLWVTLQIHLNAIAVASMKETAAVVFISGRVPNAEGIEKANDEGVILLSTPLSAFETIGRLYELGLRGTDKG